MSFRNGGSLLALQHNETGVKLWPLIDPAFSPDDVFACELEYTVLPQVCEFWSVVTVAVGVVLYLALAWLYAKRLPAHLPGRWRPVVQYLALTLSSISAGWMHGTCTLGPGPAVQIGIIIHMAILLDGAFHIVFPKSALPAARACACAIAAAAWVSRPTSPLLSKPSIMPLVLAAAMISSTLILPTALRVVGWLPRTKPFPAVPGASRLLVVVVLASLAQMPMFTVAPTTEPECGAWMGLGVHGGAVSTVATVAAHAMEHLADYFNNHLLITGNFALFVATQTAPVKVPAASREAKAREADTAWPWQSTIRWWLWGFPTIMVQRAG